MIKAHKTAVFTDDDNFTKVIYHSTKVVSFNSDTIVLNSGGYETKTTKDRMNQTAIEYYLDYMVYQKNYKWFVVYDKKCYPFQDNMQLIEKLGWSHHYDKYEVLNHNNRPIKADENETKRYYKN